MKSPLARFFTRWPFAGWLPAIITRSSRVRNQVRLLALAGLVGVVAGVGAVAFYVATRAVEHYALGSLAGYDAQPHPAANRRWRGYRRKSIRFIYGFSCWFPR